jgi:hypothetical protein
VWSASDVNVLQDTRLETLHPSSVSAPLQLPTVMPVRRAHALLQQGWFAGLQQRSKLSEMLADGGAAMRGLARAAELPTSRWQRGWATSSATADSARTSTDSSFVRDASAQTARGMSVSPSAAAAGARSAASTQGAADTQDHFPTLLKAVLIGTIITACVLNSRGVYGPIKGVLRYPA